MSNTTRLAEGSVLDDRYRIDRLLSLGGMGAVYAGTHTHLRKRVAIKVLRTELPGSRLAIDRFRREAIAASGIGHENIVEVTDMAVTADGTAYLVMELLEGHDLASEIEANAPLPVERACGLASSILRGLGAAHRNGIVHRDLKPENVFLARKPDGREVVKVLDFGISLLESTSQPDSRLTSTGTVLGTPRYMSPEQARGEHTLTAQTDIYALGVVLYELLTGQLPYLGNNYNTVIHEIIAAEWAPLETRRPDLPVELIGIVHKAMALAPEDRFESADALADELERFTGGAGEAIRTSEPAVAYDATETALPAGDAAQERPRRRVQLPSDSMLNEPAWAGSGKPKPPAPPPEPETSSAGDSLVRRPGPRLRRGAVLGLLGLGAVAALALFLASGGEEEAKAGGDAERVAAVEEEAEEEASSETAASAAPEPEPEAPPDEPEAPPDDEPEPTGKRGGAAREAKKASAEKRKPKKAEPEKPKPEKASAEKKKPEEKKPEEKKPEKVTIELLIVPPDANVLARGKPLSGRRLVVERNSGPVPIRIDAAGYRTRTMNVRADRDRELVIQLEPKPEEKPAPKTPPEEKTPDEPKAEEPAEEEPPEEAAAPEGDES